jgi:hypothetical protein
MIFLIGDYSMNKVSLFISLLIFSVICNGEISQKTNSIDEFSKRLITALEEKNTKVFEALILPESISNEIDKNRKKITLIMQQKKPSDFNGYEIVVTDIEQNKDYDVASNSVQLFGKKRAYFPVPLEKNITIYVTEGNENTEGSWTTPLMSQVLSNQAGRWHMVWPSEIK